MKFWLITSVAYALFLAVGLGAPAAGLWDRGPMSWADIGYYSLAAAGLTVASIMFCLMVSRLVFPEYWWIGQVKGDDVFQHEGVYFVGLRINRIPTRVQRLLFGVDDQTRRWDMIFGLLVVALMFPHFLGAVTVARAWDQVIPIRPKIPETLHQTMLSSLPVLREHGTGWPARRELQARLENDLVTLKKRKKKSSADYFRLAQLNLLMAFKERKSLREPYRYTPADRVYFDRGRGGQAVTFLNRILKKPASARAAWNGGALALIGFFHLSDQNYTKAVEFLDRAQAGLNDGDQSSITAYQIVLMRAQATMLQGRPAEAQEMLEKIMLNSRLPRRAQALVMEHFAEALRLRGQSFRMQETLQKALEIYKVLEDEGGQARVHLRSAAIALEEGRHQDARRLLSLASSLAHGLDDWFTVNMVGLLAGYLTDTG